MNKNYYVRKFPPPRYKRALLDLEYLAKRTGVYWQYARKGRNALEEILAHYKIKRLILPAYLCQTVMRPLKRLKIKPIFCDINPIDLNPTKKNISSALATHEADAVLATSLYGNPGDLVNIHYFCKEQGLILIDDAAQSFGALLKGQYIGTFGDAGFFSMSPGKSTVAHEGAFFWTSDQMRPVSLKNSTILEKLAHSCSWQDFYLNRYKNHGKLLLRSTFFRYISLIMKNSPLTNKAHISEFEKTILGGVLQGLFNGDYDYRYFASQKFIQCFNNKSYLQCVHSIRGEPVPHKLVCVVNSCKLAESITMQLHNRGIYVNRGYTPLSNYLEALPVTESICGKVLELPIERNKHKRDFLLQNFNAVLESHEK